MKMMKHIQTWLLITLLALSANGVANAKLASGHQNLGAGLHQSQTVLNALLHQGLEGVSTTNTSESPLAAKGLKGLQSQFDDLANAHLLPQFRKLDPNLTFGITGSFKTGLVGNPSKARFGQAIDLNDFDVDFFIKSDVLFKEFGKNLRANPEFRKILSNAPGFEGLRANKKGFSIKFLPSSQ